MTNHAAITVTTVIIDQPTPQAVIDGVLRLVFQCGEHIQAAAVCLVAKLTHDFRAHHFINVWRLHGHLTEVPLGGYRRGNGFLIGGVIDIAQLAHARQHIITTGDCALRVHNRVIP